MDTRNFTAAQKSSAGYDKGATTNTKTNPPTAGGQGQHDGGNPNHPVFTPSYNTAMTTDGFKNDTIGDEVTQHDDVTPHAAGGTQPVDQQQPKKGDKGSNKGADSTQADEGQKTQQHQGNKLRGVFGRLKKGSDTAGDEAVEGGEESEGKQKTKGDGMVIE